MPAWLGTRPLSAVHQLRAQQTLPPLLLVHARIATTPLPTPSSQVVRQRDTLRQLLQSSGNDLDAARQAYATSLGGAASPGGVAGAGTPAPGSGTPGQGAGGDAGAGTPSQASPDYRGMHADLESQFKEYKEEAAKTQEMLGKDVSGAGRFAVCSGDGWASRDGRPEPQTQPAKEEAVQWKAPANPACLTRSPQRPCLVCSWHACERRPPPQRARRRGLAPRPSLSGTAPHAWRRAWRCSASRWVPLWRSRLGSVVMDPGLLCLLAGRPGGGQAVSPGI